MSIKEALQKHNLTFKEACDTLSYRNTCKERGRGKQREEKEWHRADTYIQSRNGHYYVRKCVPTKKGARTLTFGAYSSLRDAQMMRDALIKDGWHRTHVDRICEELNIVRRKGLKSKVRYH